MHGKLLLRISVVVAISLWMLEQLVGNELLPDQSLFDKALEEIVQKIDKAEKSCEKLIDREEQHNGRVTPKCFKNMNEINFKGKIMNFQ